MVNWSHLDTLFLDMDGTLLDLHFDNHFWLEHLPRRYAEHHAITPDQAKARLMPMIQAQQGTLNWYCTDYWSDLLNLDITQLKAEIGDRIGYRPHVPEFLSAAKAAGLRTVIVTNCHPDPLALKLQRTGLDKRVDRVISSHTLRRPKEDAEFWHDLHQLEPYQPGNTLMVDDSLPVLQSAARAGIGQCLAVLAPDSRQPARKDAAGLPAIHHFDEVLPHLLGLGQMPS
ncbi:GMP/IMP nucleotidase [Marinobacter zhejiangensis]|uniref:Putative hydrolase of the HAD superfamily n=1 Tax=Marinobacter zhejiangensis TaxID=488535 RepID=A0A1I4LD23_9GAMM|nr:GMP/IMP nucleotidase [Marinobacter zhejiangensis]SFL88935.1 putative hydrolase of the HAD superfamily [Marinobacter zhejiangensis]